MRSCIAACAPLGTLKAWLKSADMSKPSKPLSYPFAPKEFKKVAPAADGEIRAALVKGLEAGTITHITKKGRELTGIIVVNPMLVPAQAEEIDARAFRKTGEKGAGWFIRENAARAYLGEEAAAKPDAARIATVKNQEAAPAVPPAVARLRAIAERAEAAAADDATQSAKPKPAKPRPKRETLQKRPLIHRVRTDIGQIDPDGPFGREAYALGLNAQSAPGLFRRGGLKNLDNIPANDHPEVAEIVGIAEDGNYLDEGRLLELMLEEVAGTAAPIGQQAALQQDARDAAAVAQAGVAAEQEAGTGYEPASEAMRREYFVPDPEVDMRTPSERYQDIRDAVAETIETYLDDLGPFTGAEIGYIVNQLDVAGGSVLAAMQQVYARSIRNDDQVGQPANTSAGTDSALPDAPFGPEDEARYLSGETDGTGAVGKDRPGIAEGDPGSSGQRDNQAPGEVTPGADGKPQVQPSSPGTFANWIKAVPSTGRARGWTVFNDTKVGGSWVLMSTDLRAGPFETQQAAREWAQSNPEAGFDDVAGGNPAADAPAAPAFEPGADGKPQAIMPGMEGGDGQQKADIARRQKAEIEARQKQSKMRRLGGNEGDAGPLFGDGPKDMFDTPAKPREPDYVDRFNAAKAEGVAKRQDDAEWWARTSRESDGQVARDILEKAGVGFDRIGRPWGDVRADDQAKIIRARDEAEPPVSEEPPAPTHRIEAAIKRIETEGRGKKIADEFRAMLASERDDLADTQKIQRKSRDGSIYDEDIARIESRISDIEGRIVSEAEGIKPAAKQPEAVTPPAVSAQAKPGAKIEDFGEKIGGARKDVWSGFKEKMAEAENLNVAVEPLARSWPEPDYEKLIEAGVDPWTVSFVRAARDMIPRKPAKSWKLKGWAEQVKVLRDFASGLLNDRIDQADLKAKLEKYPDLNTKIGGKIAMYGAVGHGQSLKELSFGEQTYSMLGGVYFDKPRSFWEVTKAQAATAWSNMPKTLVRADTRDEALAKFKASFKPSEAADAAKKKSGPKFTIYSMRGAEGPKYRIGVKIGSDYVDLRTGIADVKEARRIVAEEADQLQEKLEAMRTIPNERRDENAPRLGADHRSGADVSPEQFAETFGFRGVEFGNWVEQGRRKQDLNDAYDGLCCTNP